MISRFCPSPINGTILASLPRCVARRGRYERIELRDTVAVF